MILRAHKQSQSISPDREASSRAYHVFMVSKLTPKLIIPPAVDTLPLFIFPKHATTMANMATAVTHTSSLPYEQEKETSATLEWAELYTLDLSKFETEAGKHELVEEFSKAIKETGMSRGS